MTYFRAFRVFRGLKNLFSKNLSFKYANFIIDLFFNIISLGFPNLDKPELGKSHTSVSLSNRRETEITE
jgi:hypothetical protein